MEHLNPEDVARLVDEPPTPEEAEHLSECSACTTYLEGMKAQTIALGALADPEVPSQLRIRLETELVREGLVRSPQLPLKVAGGWRRAAAGFVLFLFGAASGSVVTSRGLPLSAGVATTAEVVDLTEAAAWMESAEANYLQAVRRYAELAESGVGLDPVNRLAALEGIVLTTEAALREAPADPVINNYHLTAMGQRDALLRQLAVASADDEWF